jgi:branched-chain amino acid transport system ATP-binding protein
LRLKDKAEFHENLKKMYELFPRLEERKKQLGKTLSGGELQMLAVARALMAKPKLLMLDEPSTGLAPLVVRDIFNILKNVCAAGTTVLLVEQNAKMALAISDRGYVLKNGSIVLEDTGKNLLGNDEVRKAYLGEKVYGCQ